MRKIALLAVLMFVAVPAAFAEDSPSPSTQPSTLCKQQRNAIGMAAFKLLYGSSNAYGKCVSKAASAASQSTTNASKQCAAERADATFAASHDGKTFAQFYGTGPNGRNAFGKCVSSKAQDARAGTAAGHDQRCEGLQGRAQRDGRRRVHGEVRRPLERLREMRRQDGKPVNGLRNKERRAPDASHRPGRGAWRAPPLPYTSGAMALRTMAPAFLRKRDDDKAFERLYERHVRDVYRYAAAMLGATADAEDVTQTTFLNAYRAFKNGTRPEKPQSWLMAIAHNVCRQRFRQAQRRPHEVAFDEGVGDGELAGRRRRAVGGGHAARAVAAAAQPARRDRHARARRRLVRRDRRRARHQRLRSRDAALPRAPRAAGAARGAARVLAKPRSRSTSRSTGGSRSASVARCARICARARSATASRRASGRSAGR